MNIRTQCIPMLVVAFGVGSAVSATGASYSYWQMATGSDGRQTGPTHVDTVTRDQPPTPDQPITVTPKPVEDASEYSVLRVPDSRPAAPTVTVVNKGDDTFYYWLVGHAGLHRSPIVGPAVAENCDAGNLENIVRWQRSGDYAVHTVLRTESADVPSGVMHALLSWGNGGTNVTDRGGQRVLADYPCYPEGTAGPRPPAGDGHFLVGTSQGNPVQDTGALKRILVSPATEIVENDPNLFEVHNSRRQGAMGFRIKNDQPTGKYDWGGPVGLYIDQTDLAGGHNDYTQLGGGPHAKSFHIPFWLWQHNYTAGQVANQVIYSEKHGEGDSVLLTIHTTTDGLVEDGGDEGTEIFMSSANRELTVYNYELREDVSRHGTRLKVTPRYKRTGTGRVVVNMSRSESRGSIIRIDDDMKLNPDVPDRHQWNRVTRLTGEGTQWTPSMTGWYISLDCDTRSDGIRQWYRIMRVNSQTSLDIYAYTFFSTSTYLGHAANVVRHGAAFRDWAGDRSIKHEPRGERVDAGDGRESYTIVPATAVADPSQIGADLHVLPLKEAWAKGDKFRIVAGPQNSISIGKMAVNGKMLPQDWVHGLWMYNWSDRLSNGGALVIMGKWSKGIEILLDDEGLSDGVKVTGKAGSNGGAFVAPSETTAMRITDIPVVLGGRTNTEEVVWARDGHDGEALLAVGRDRVRVGPGTSLQGNPHVRGRTRLSGDGTTQRFTIAFARPHHEPPYVVASPNLAIGMGVESVSERDFTVAFAEPPPDGDSNVVVTWMVME